MRRTRPHEPDDSACFSAAHAAYRFLALTSNEIQRSFQIVQAMDNDLNGTPDLLEDSILSTNVPFAGVPFTVTGVFEAEQFDRGGKGVAYNNMAQNFWTNDYRPSGMEITNCADFGGGYCVDRLQAGD